LELTLFTTAQYLTENIFVPVLHHREPQRTTENPVPLLLVGARLLSVKEYVEKYRVMFHYFPLFTLSAQNP